jgi:pentatricopeptide repeat protein
MLKNTEIKPNIDTYNLFIFFYLKLNHYEHAYKQLNEIKSQGLSPNTVSYNKLLGFLVEKNQFLEFTK